MNKDIITIRELAKQVKEISMNHVMEERRRLWERHNSLERVRVPIYIRDGNWSNEIIKPDCTVENPALKDTELFLRKMIYQYELDDDYVIEPWITVRAELMLPGEGTWGVMYETLDSGFSEGAKKFKSPITDLSDLSALKVPVHKVDEQRTREKYDVISDAVGGILEVDIDRSPHWWIWEADISTRLGYMRGLEQIMWDVYDDPEGLHNLLSFMRDGILKAQQEAEDLNDIGLTSACNQSMPYLEGMKRPKPNTSAKRKDIWGFMAAQEFALISPEHHEIFMLDYQKPIMEKFNVTAYGCCEDLTYKMDMLRKIKNLRRIAVSPFSDVRRMAEELGRNYVASYRPDPSETVSFDLDASRVSSILKKAKQAYEDNGCIYDLCLKDVHTIQKDRSRLIEFVKIAKSVLHN